MQFVPQAASASNSTKYPSQLTASPMMLRHSEIATPPSRPYCVNLHYRFAKRLIDVLAAITLLALLSPVFLVVAAAVKLSSPGPILFRQQRLTEGGRTFQLIKFRSMVTNAEQASGAQFARRQDPRVTGVGNFIRKTRLDELPQLINVLKGDMSLIGPRPERPELAQQLTQTIKRFPQRLSAKAGITGQTRQKRWLLG